MNNKCLYCYSELAEGLDFHENCSLEFFGSKDVPVLSYTIDQMAELARNVVKRSPIPARIMIAFINTCFFFFIFNFIFKNVPPGGRNMAAPSLFR